MSWFHRKGTLEELAERIRELLRKVLGDDMAQVQFSVTIDIATPLEPLTLGATSGTANFTQNVQGTDTLTPVSGGLPPYTVTVDAASEPLPPGLTASLDQNNNLTISGTPTTPGSFTVTLDVADSAIATAAVKKA